MTTQARAILLVDAEFSEDKLERRRVFFRAWSYYRWKDDIIERTIELLIKQVLEAKTEEEQDKPWGQLLVDMEFLLGSEKGREYFIHENNQGIFAIPEKGNVEWVPEIGSRICKNEAEIEFNRAMGLENKFISFKGAKMSHYEAVKIIFPELYAEHRKEICETLGYFEYNGEMYRGKAKEPNDYVETILSDRDVFNQPPGGYFWKENT
jgi:hypothetical protein